MIRVARDASRRWGAGRTIAKRLDELSGLDLQSGSFQPHIVLHLPRSFARRAPARRDDTRFDVDVDSDSALVGTHDELGSDTTN